MPVSTEFDDIDALFNQIVNRAQTKITEENSVAESPDRRKSASQSPQSTGVSKMQVTIQSHGRPLIPTELKVSIDEVGSADASSV